MRGVWSEGRNSGIMDGERGNSEPGIVEGGGFKNALSRRTGEGGLRDTCSRLGISLGDRISLLTRGILCVGSIRFVGTL